jgi:adenylosuccinate lyase
MRAWHGEGRFRDLLSADPEVAIKLGERKLDELFDLKHALAHVPAILERALAPT